MIRVGVVRFAEGGVPSRDLGRVLFAVLRQMQVDPAAEDMIGILRMNREGVAVRHLVLVVEVISPSCLLQLAPLSSDRKTPSTPSPSSADSAYITEGFEGAIASEVRPICSGDGRPFVKKWVQDSASVGGFPDAVLRAARLDRREQRAADFRMVHNRVASIGAGARKCQPSAQLRPPLRDADVPSLPSPCVTPPRQRCVEFKQIDDEATDAGGDARWSWPVPKLLPGLASIGGPENANTGIGIGGKIRFSGVRNPQSRGYRDQPQPIRY